MCETLYGYSTIWRGARGTSSCRKYDSSNSKYLRGKHGIVFDGTKKIDYTAKEREAINNVANRIVQYFNCESNTLNNQCEFDLFHNELCDDFIADLHIVRNIVGFDSISYGQAQ